MAWRFWQWYSDPAILRLAAGAALEAVVADMEEAIRNSATPHDAAPHTFLSSPTTTGEGGRGDEGGSEGESESERGGEGRYEGEGENKGSQRPLVACRDAPPVSIFSGHDVTLLPLLAALVWSPERMSPTPPAWPPYAASMVIELVEDADRVGGEGMEQRHGDPIDPDTLLVHIRYNFATLAVVPYASFVRRVRHVAAGRPPVDV